MKLNPITACDFYKVSHKEQYPEGTTKIYSNFTPRSNKLAAMVNGKSIDKVLVCGLQGFIKDFLIESFNENFFNLPKEQVVKEYNRRMDSSLGRGAVDSSHIAALHDLGYLPILIRALPEGTLCPVKVPVLTITNTKSEFFWLTNYLETVLSTSLWKIMTNATYAFEYRKILNRYANETSSNLDFVLWQGHDFSMRGQGSLECSAISGAGHLFSFLGSDTIPSIEYLEKYYNAENDFVAGSVPASEHSVMCVGGKGNEKETIRRLIQDVHPTGVVSVVCDTWNFWNTISKTIPELKDVILNRPNNALGLSKVVIRPDSGDPVDVICGFDYFDMDKEFGESDNPEDFRKLYKFFGWAGTYYVLRNKKYFEVEIKEEQWYNLVAYDSYEIIREIQESEIKGAVEVLWDNFGGIVNNKGFKELDSHIGLIYGDSITLERAQQILQKLKEKGFASTNVVFGIGSFTYQYVTRDTFGFAIKATYAEVNGEARELFKDPVTDSGTKKSAKGLLQVIKDSDNNYVLKDQVTSEEEFVNTELQVVFRDGVLYREDSLSNIRSRVNSLLE